MGLTYFICHQKTALLTTNYCCNCKACNSNISNTYTQEQVDNNEHVPELISANKSDVWPMFPDLHRIY